MEKLLLRQKAIEQFIATEILSNQTALVEEVMKHKIISVDEIYNLYREFDGQLLSPNICVSCKNEYPFLDSETGQCEVCFEEEQLPQEIYEWWLVSSWFGKKLLLKDEPIIDNNYGTWWGRCVTGQVIAMDEIINSIYDEVKSYEK